MQKKITPNNLARGSLLFLLAWRLLISIVVYWSGKIEMPNWEEVAFLCVSYSLISITLWVNKSDLYKINIDKSFIRIFIVLGFVYSFLVPLVFGVLLGTVTMLSVGVLFSSKSCFAKSELSNISFIVCLAILLVLDFIYFIVIQKARLFASNTVFIDAVFWANPPFVMVEEFLFRGLLWKLLRDYEFSESKIIYSQAVLFWLFHFYLEPIVFWIFLPLISILWGYLTSRAKSITPSMFLHLLHNVFSFIFRY